MEVVSVLRLLGISGSLRDASTNTRLLLAATQLLPAGVEWHLTSYVGELPPFRSDADPERIDVVARWVQEVRVADGIVVSTPEYARGYPGALKNAFDWLVGTDAFIDKPFMFLSANPRSTVAQDTLTVVLETMSGRHVASASTVVPLLGTTLTVTDIVEHREFAERIREALSRFVSAVR